MMCNLQQKFDGWPIRRWLLVVTALILAISSGLSLPTRAYNREFYEANNIYFYGPSGGGGCAAPGGAVAGAISSLRGGNNAEKIYNFWLDAGLNHQQSAGILGSMFHESSFSPFRQEEADSTPWPEGGWGIAQFTAAQRDAATAYVKEKLGAELFNQYYQDQYGGRVSEANGFIPDGVPPDVNDKFLLAELNYLLEYIKAFPPSDIPLRPERYSGDWGFSIEDGKFLYDHLKEISTADQASKAWTYLYEFPGDIRTTAAERAVTAEEYATQLQGGTSGGTSSSDPNCAGPGGLVAGGMTLDEAVKFMESYKSDPQADSLLGGAGRDCSGGPLANCVSFTVYFINKYTKLKGFDSGAPGHGVSVAGNVIDRNPGVQSGTEPRPYAIFSTPSTSEYGHTGIILGVDTAKQTVIVGEAGCGFGMDWITAREKPLAEFQSGYTYAYTEGYLTGLEGQQGKK